MKRAQNRLRFLHLQLIDRQPETGDPALFQPTLHQRKKLFGVKIDGTRHFRRRRFSGNYIVLLRAGLKEEAPVLDYGADTGVAQRIRVIDVGIEIGETEDFFRNVHDVHALDVRPVEQRICGDAAPVTDKQYIFRFRTAS